MDHLATCPPHSEVTAGPPDGLGDPVPTTPNTGETRCHTQAHPGPLRNVRTCQTGVRPVPTALFSSGLHYHLLHCYIPSDHQFRLPRPYLSLTLTTPLRNRTRPPPTSICLSNKRSQLYKHSQGLPRHSPDVRMLNTGLHTKLEEVGVCTRTRLEMWVVLHPPHFLLGGGYL